MPASPNPWITCPRPNPDAALRLYCLPHAGGGAGIFRTWSASLPEAVEVRGLQLPGRESRLLETPFENTVPAVAALVEAFVPDLDRPYALFGHSMGALIGFELCRELRRRGVELPRHVFASAYRAPQLPDPEPPLYQLPQDEFLTEVNRRYDAVPQEVLNSAELLELMLPGLRADIAICDTYSYQEGPPLPCDLSAFGGREDGQVPEDTLRAWQDQTSGRFELHMFEGGHFFLQSAEAAVLQQVHRVLQETLDAG